MNANFDPTLIRLRKGSLRPHPTEHGMGIAVFEGRVWLTQDNDMRDVVLDAGDTFTFDRSGRVIMQALRDARLLVFDNANGATQVGRA